MNIFAINKDPVLAAQEQCDQHVRKMTVETGQLLSTAHRIIDGTETIILKNGRKCKRWVHPDNHLDKHLYLATHYNHPSNIWARETSENYNWLYKHFCALSKEFTYRSESGNAHLTYIKLKDILKYPPKNIKKSSLTKFKLAMKSQPQCMNEDDPIASYREFYKTKKETFNTKITWTKRKPPVWF